MILVDKSIKERSGEIFCEGYAEKYVNAISYDLHITPHNPPAERNHMQPYMLEEFPPEISRLQPLFFSSDFGDQGKYLLSLYRSFYLCLCIAHDIIPLRPDLPYPVHDELPALSPKKRNGRSADREKQDEEYESCRYKRICWYA